MTQPISADQPIATVRDGRILVDPVWFRYFVDVGEVDLTADVVGILPAANGGTGIANSTATVSVTAVATTVIAQDVAMLFVVHDQTSGGVSVGVMDATGVVMIVSGVANVTFSRLAGTGLRAVVTAGANPRVLLAFALSVGAP